MNCPLLSLSANRRKVMTAYDLILYPGSTEVTLNLSLPQDWEEKYIHENYTAALKGKLVEMVRKYCPCSSAFLSL